MALIDTQCKSCARVEEQYRHNSDWPKTPACTGCGGETEQIHLPSFMRGHSVDPVIVYQAPDGSFRFPPDIETSSTKMYDDQGLTRIELRGWADVRRFEKHMNESEMSQVRRRVEKQQEQFERGESERRSEIRRGLEQGFQIPDVDERGVPNGRMRTVRLSGYGRKVLEHAIANNDRKGGPTAKEVGFRVSAYSDDRSNREADPRRSGQ